MNGTMKYIMYIAATLLTLCFCGCSDETLVDNPKGEGALLNMYASVATANTRLAELPLDKISVETDGKQDVGLYIYYEDDYKAGNLSKPYIRNLHCTVANGKLVAESGKEIYIYDRMTIVAFYPYNATVIDFEKKDDEKAYPITESDYSKQTYIPYRAQTNVNPTNAYMIELIFKPQQTCKVEVVLVAENTSDFPEETDLTNGDIKLLPSVDRYKDGGDYDTDKGDLRENWLDAIEDFPKTGTTPTGGKYVRRYTAYVWKSGAGDPHHDESHKHNDNILKKGDILFQSKKLTLVVPAQVNLSEETVYRYGYNMNTGEIFIPTSDNLIYDATSLQDASFNEYRAYQVCDIDLSTTTEWKPLTTYNGIYDGGGHQIKGLDYTVTPTTNIGADPDKQMFGLFSSITGTSTLMNIHLVSPKITVTYSNESLKDTCYVGAICGLVNPELSDEQKRKLLDVYPAELSETVRKALIEEQLKNWGTTTCKIRGCKVSNPEITVTGENVRVGALCGGAGNRKQKAEIKDSYTTGGSIAVNAAPEEEVKVKYKQVYVSGFCGMLAHGEIKYSYSTMTSVSGYVGETTNGDPTVTAKDLATGFCNLAPEEEKAGTPAVTDCYTVKEDMTEGATLFSSSSWPSNWPLFKDDNEATNHTQFPGLWPAYKWEDSWKDMGTSPSNYPILIWEERFIIENK